MVLQGSHLSSYMDKKPETSHCQSQIGDCSPYIFWNLIQTRKFCSTAENETIVEANQIQFNHEDLMFYMISEHSNRNFSFV